ncbi:MAG: hypothetical protein ABSF91_09495 [Bacteroidota bacterium]|jgi:hypothetical protein
MKDEDDKMVREWRIGVIEKWNNERFGDNEMLRDGSGWVWRERFKDDRNER